MDDVLTSGFGQHVVNDHHKIITADMPYKGIRVTQFFN